MHKKTNNVDFEWFHSIGIKLTGNCDYNCPFCCEPNRGQQEYPSDNFLKIIYLLKKYGTSRLCLTGGDPLLYPELPKILHQIQLLNFDSILLTANGILFQREYERIASYLDAVRFSVHGIGVNHDKVVKRDGSFESIERSLSLMAGTNIKRYVTTVVTNVNINYLGDIVRWCVENEISKLFFFGLMKSGRGAKYYESGGSVADTIIVSRIDELRGFATNNGLDLVYYDYRKKAECVLIYGDGRTVVDPHTLQPNYQMYIGNVLTDSIDIIKEKFRSDPENLSGYIDHSRRYYMNSKG